MQLYNLVSEYFTNVINYTDFVIAVEKTGVFVFSVGEEDRAVLIKLSKLLNDLELRKDQVIVCIIDESTDNVYSSFDCVEREGDLAYVHRVPVKYFEDFVRKYASAGEQKLSKRDIIEIMECFYDELGASLEKDELYERLRPYELSDEAIKELLSNPNLTKELVYSVGVKHEYADAVFNIVAESRGAASCGQKGALLSFASESKQKLVKKRRVGAVIAVFAAVMFMVFRYWWLGAPLFCLALCLWSNTSAMDAMIYSGITFAVCYTASYFMQYSEDLRVDTGVGFVESIEHAVKQIIVVVVRILGALARVLEEAAE